MGAPWLGALWLLAASIGCGGESTEAPDGTGGTSACLAAAVQPAPNVGFQQTWAPGTYVVVSSSSDRVELASGPDILEFRWIGPDLTNFFALGKSVGVAAESDWIVLSTPGRAAALLRADSPQPRTVPSSGLSFSYVPECNAPQPNGGCRAGHAIAFDDHTIGLGETGAVGGWQVTNAFSVASGSCEGTDATFISVVAALRTQ